MRLFVYLRSAKYKMFRGPNDLWRFDGDCGEWSYCGFWEISRTRRAGIVYYKNSKFLSFRFFFLWYTRLTTVQRLREKTRNPRINSFAKAFLQHPHDFCVCPCLVTRNKRIRFLIDEQKEKLVTGQNKSFRRCKKVKKVGWKVVLSRHNESKVFFARFSKENHVSQACKKTRNKDMYVSQSTVCTKDKSLVSPLCVCAILPPPPSSPD